MVTRFPVWFTRGVQQLQQTNANLKIGDFHVVRSGKYKGQQNTYVHDKDNCTSDSCSALGLISLLVTVASPRRTNANIQINACDVIDCIVKVAVPGLLLLSLPRGKVLQVHGGALDNAELTDFLQEHELTCKLETQVC
jgi:hypothetical protein